MRGRVAGAALVLGLAVLAGCASGSRSGEKAKADPAYLNAQLGVAYMRQGRNETALRKLQKALRENPDLPDAHHYIAVLYNHLGEREKARRHFERALDLSPKDSSLQNNYGVFLCDQGQYKEAEKHFQKVLADPLYTQPAEINENIAVCAQRHGDLPRAQKYFDRALKIEPKRPRSLLGLAEIAADQRQFRLAHSYLADYLAAARPTPASLWLGIKVARALGNRDELASYSLLLRGQYPDSPQAKLLDQSQKVR